MARYRRQSAGYNNPRRDTPLISKYFSIFERSQIPAPNFKELPYAMRKIINSHLSVGTRSDEYEMLYFLHELETQTDDTTNAVGPLLTPAQIRRSISPDLIMSFEDGRSYKSLRPHLTSLGLSPSQYRKKWGLPSDYPMVSENYSQQCRHRAKRRRLNLERNNIGAPGSTLGTEPTLEQGKSSVINRPSRLSKNRSKSQA